MDNYIEEAKKDQDKDGDTDFADVMIARMKASGMSHEDAVKAVQNKEYNKRGMTNSDKIALAATSKMLEKERRNMKNEENMSILEANKRSAKKLIKAKKDCMEESLNLNEAGMPSSVIKHKQKLANMSDEELANTIGHKSEEELQKMAWRHGYGGPGTRGHEHYIRRVMNGLESEVEATMNMEQTKDPYAESDTAGLDKPVYGGGNESNKRMKRDKTSPVNRPGKSNRQDYKGPDMNFATNPNLPFPGNDMGKLIRKLKSERYI